jgi:outer membrane protein OmpA-like peptidoglycan-associated protein
VLGLRGLWWDSDVDMLDSLSYVDDNDTLRWEQPGKRGRCWIGDFLFALGFSFTEYLSLNMNCAYHADVMRTDVDRNGSGAASYGLGDTHLGMKFTPTRIRSLVSAEVSKVFELGLYPMISFETGRDRGNAEVRCAHDTVYGEPCRRQNGGIHRYFTAGGLTSGGKVLLTLNIPTEPKLPIHVNFGYVTYPEPAVASKMSYGVGIECVYPGFTPFVEIFGEERQDRNYSDMGLYLTPGLRFGSVENVWITLAVDFRLSKEPPEMNNDKYRIQGGFGGAPDWVLNFNISQGYDFRPPPPMGKAVIAGRVMDENGKPVRAVVFFADTNVASDVEGAYKMEIEPGKVVGYASPVNKDAYLPSEEVTKYVSGGEKEIVNFRLKSKPKEEAPKAAILMGKVIDQVTKALLSATISFPETSLPSVTADASGVFKTEVPAETYVVKVEKEGYVPETHPVVCKAGATATLDVELSPVPTGVILAGKVTDYSSHKGIAATISFPESDIATVKTDPETGTYKANIPDGIHQVKIQSEGYVPEGAVVECQPGATVVRNFELFKKEEKIVLRGINFEFNSAVIKPGSYPILNDAAEMLKKHPDVMIEIGGHTDKVGSDSYNLNLSQLRAASVMTYLVQQGVRAQRLQTRGYGEAMPVADNNTEAGRALNRRIEFRILSQ